MAMQTSLGAQFPTCLAHFFYILSSLQTARPQCGKRKEFFCSKESDSEALCKMPSSSQQNKPSSPKNVNRADSRPSPTPKRRSPILGDLNGLLISMFSSIVDCNNHLSLCLELNSFVKCDVKPSYIMQIAQSNSWDADVWLWLIHRPTRTTWDSEREDSNNRGEQAKDVEIPDIQSRQKGGLLLLFGNLYF